MTKSEIITSIYNEIVSTFNDNTISAEVKTELKKIKFSMAYSKDELEYILKHVKEMKAPKEQLVPDQKALEEYNELKQRLYEEEDKNLGKLKNFIEENMLPKSMKVTSISINVVEVGMVGSSHNFFIQYYTNINNKPFLDFCVGAKSSFNLLSDDVDVNAEFFGGIHKFMEDKEKIKTVASMMKENVKNNKIHMQQLLDSKAKCQKKN